MAHQPRRLTVTMDDLEKILARTRSAIDPDDHEKLSAAIETLGFLSSELENKNTSLRRLRRMLFGPSTEKTREVCGTPATAPADGNPPSTAPAAASQEPTAPAPQGDKPRRPGHGRNGAGDYTGLPLVKLSHPELKVGETCPGCRRGTLAADEEPDRLLRIVSFPPIFGKRFELEKLRCTACRHRYKTPSPEGVGEEKYDDSVRAMTTLFKYGIGIPFQRLERLQKSFGIPFPASTQFQLVAELAPTFRLVRDELIRQAAQGELFHNDDTYARILERMKALRRAEELEDKVERTGTFTSTIISHVAGRRIALFFTGANHAGENLQRVLQERATSLPPPMLMCDGLERNLPRSLAVVVLNCLAHGRRHVVDMAAVFPTACREVLEELGHVYKNDETARDKQMSPEERLAYHQTHSGPVMEVLKARIDSDLAEKRVEPNSGLGKAFLYLQKRWDRLTRFLHIPGAPLDNNLAERALKRAILNRKNAMFYKTQFGADVGDLCMSLIHTAELAGANVFEYLLALARNRALVEAAPARWLPWNYKDALPAPPPGG